MVRVLNSDIKINKNEILKSLKRINVHLPKEIIDFYCTSNGGEPEKYLYYDEDEDEYVVQCFIPIFSEVKKDITKLVEEFRTESTIPNWFIPIAYDPGGNMFGVSVDKEDYGYIYYWNTDYDLYEEGFEDNIIFLEESFNKFLDKLLN